MPSLDTPPVGHLLPNHVPMSFSAFTKQSVKEGSLEAYAKVLDVLFPRALPPLRADRGLEHVFDVVLHDHFVGCDYQASKSRPTSLLLGHRLVDHQLNFLDAPLSLVYGVIAISRLVGVSIDQGDPVARCVRCQRDKSFQCLVPSFGC